MDAYGKSNKEEQYYQSGAVGANTAMESAVERRLPGLSEISGQIRWNNFGKGEINDKEKEEPGKAFAEEAGKEVGIKDGGFNSFAGIVGRVQINRESWPTVGGWIQERGAEWQKQTAERYMTYIRMISVSE